MLNKSLVRRTIILGLFILVASVGAFYKTIEFYIEKPVLVQSPTLITIKSGTSFYHFSQQLVQLGIIDNRFWLRNYVRFRPQMSDIKAGTYQVIPEMTLSDLLLMLVNNEEHQFSITFVEGTTFKEWLAQLNKHPQLNNTLANLSLKQANKILAAKLEINHDNVEGLFFPDTYQFTGNTKDIDILNRAYRQMQLLLANLWQQRNQRLPYQSDYQALIMASIIEKESGRHAEHETIASVFINRLHKKMRLQTDPTVIYGLGERYKGDITRKHLREKTPYNTYRIDGLPPTPIAMPGKSALLAAFNPATTDYLYFVSDGNGKHIFSTNLTDHNKAVAKYQLGN